MISLDPRPQYLEQGDREYGFGFAGYEIRFKADGEKITVLSAEKK